MMIYFKILVVCLALSCSCGFADGQMDFGGTMMEKMFASMNNVASNADMGERHEFKEQVRADHVNDDSFDETTQEIIESAGFKSVTHSVTTADGYITELINVVNPLADPNQLRRPPVVMFHGATIDSTCFVWASIRQHHPEKYPRNYYADGPITSSNRSLAFVLANNGYDVWLAHSRGSNKQNIRHTQYQTQFLEDLLPQMTNAMKSLEHGRAIVDTLKYFEYNQDHLVELEYPKQIDEVIRLTDSRRVSVVSYSKSGQIMFKLLASDPIHARRIHSHVSLGPCLNTVGGSNIFKFLFKLALQIPDPVGNLVFTQIVTSGWIRRIGLHLDRYSIVYFLSNLLGGPSPRYQTFLENPVVGHLLKPISFQEIRHFAQQMLAGKLQKFDYGPERNAQLYNGSATPPEYELANIKLKRWMLVTSDLDTLGTPSSAQYYHKMHQTKPYEWIQLNKANHVDLSAHVENDFLVNLPILRFLNKFHRSCDHHNSDY